MFLIRKIESPSGIFPVKLILRTLDVITSNVTGMKIRSKLGHVTVLKSRRKKKKRKHIPFSALHTILCYNIAPQGKIKTPFCGLL